MRCSLRGWTGEAEEVHASEACGKTAKKQKTNKSEAKSQKADNRSHPEAATLPYLPFQLNTGKIPFTATQASKE